MSSLTAFFVGVLSTASFNAPEGRVVHEHKAGVTGVKFSQNGEWLASCSLDGFVSLVDAKSWKLAHALHHGAEVYAIAFSRDGSLLASSGLDGRIVLWEASSGEIHGEVKLPEWSVAIAFNSSDELVVGSTDTKIRILDPSTGEIRRTMEAGNEILSLAVSERGTFCASAIPIKLWDLESGRSLKTLRGHGQGGLAISPADDFLVSAEWTGGARTWALPDGSPKSTLRIEKQKQVLGPTGFTTVSVNMPITSVEFSPDGTLLASGCSDSAIQLWKVANADVIQPPSRVLEGHSMTVTSVCFSPDGDHLASGSLDRSVRLWDVLQKSP